MDPIYIPDGVDPDAVRAFVAERDRNEHFRAQREARRQAREQGRRRKANKQRRARNRARLAAE